MTFEDLPVAPKRLPIRYPPLKQLIIFCLPFPKSVPTAPELVSREPGEWSDEVSILRAFVEQAAGRDKAEQFPAHPAFGKLTPRAWGVLAYRHLDHHLRQFGV
jgi:hypothetical protein